MTDTTDYAPKARSLRQLLPRDVTPIPGSVPLPEDKLTGMADKLHGYLKEINDNRVYQIASALKQLTWDEAESIGNGLFDVIEKREDAGEKLTGSKLTQVIQAWATTTVKSD
jgi:hypothetical protein